MLSQVAYAVSDRGSLYQATLMMMALLQSLSRLTTLDGYDCHRTIIVFEFDLLFGSTVLSSLTSAISCLDLFLIIHCGAISNLAKSSIVLSEFFERVTASRSVKV